MTKDKSKSVYDGDNVGKSDVKTEHLKQTKRCDKQVKGTRAMLSKKKIHQIKKKVSDDKNHPHKQPHHQRTVSGRAVNVNQHFTMKIIVFQSLDNHWYLHKTSNLEHNYHTKT